MRANHVSMYKVLCVAVLTVLSGCATRGPNFVQLDRPQEGEALLYFYRTGQEPWNIKGRNLRIFINFVNKENMNIVPYGSYISFPVKPGKIYIVSDSATNPFLPLLGHILEGSTKRANFVELDVNSGDIVFVKLHARDAVTYIASNLIVQPKEIALKELEKAYRAQ